VILRGRPFGRSLKERDLASYITKEVSIITGYFFLFNLDYIE